MVLTSTIKTKAEATKVSLSITPTETLVKLRDELQAKIQHVKPKLVNIDSDDFDWNADEETPTAEELRLQKLELQLSAIRRDLSYRHSQRRAFANLEYGQQVVF